MEAKWEETTVGDLVQRGILERPLDGNHGSIHPRGNDFISAGVPFIMASDLVNGGIDTVNCSFISHKRAMSLRKGFAKSGDVLLSHKATLGRTALVGKIPGDFVMLTPQVTYYRSKDPSRLNNRFLKYYFDSEKFQTVLHSWAGAGSTRAYIGITDQLRLPVTLPPIGAQKGIASVLGALDDKIELNRRMNATMEAIARALFQSWFVDFDPLRAKLDGRQPIGLDPATAALFPNECEDSDLGPIPKGWKVGKVEDVLSFSRSTINPSGFPDELFALYSLPAFDEGRVPKLELGSAIKSQKLLVPPDAVLLSKLNPHIPRIWLPDVTTKQPAICSTEFLVAQPKPDVSREFLFCLFTSGLFASEYATLVTGTTGSHQRVKGESVVQMPVAVPPIQVLFSFSKLAKPTFEKINESIRESITLAAIRDTLLPKLLSGKVSVNITP